MNVTAFVVDGRPISVGRRIGRGGEGEVYTIAGDPTLALKVYTARDLASREAKIALMIQQDLGRRVPLAAFPLAIARRPNGSFAGFSMRLVENHQPLFELYSPGARKNAFPNADYRFLVRAALNIARAFGAVHSKGCVVGDVNHSGILLSHKATATLIDADSFQIIHGAHKHLCKVGVPEYTPPELQGQPLSRVIRTINHDAFGLAVILFQLLFMGRHPFVGSVRQGEVPTPSEAIRNNRFVYAENRNVGMDRPPGTPVLSNFPQPIGECFHTAFCSASGGTRPAAGRWIEALTTLENSLIPCPAHKAHFYPATASKCLWCHMDRECGTLLFLTPVTALTDSAGFDPNQAGFDIVRVWRQIDAIVIPNPEAPPLGVFGFKPSGPSEEARRAKLKDRTKDFGRAFVLLVVFLAFLLLPEGLFIWLVLGTIGWKALDTPDFSRSLQHQLRELDSQWVSAVEQWRRRSGIDECHRLKETLREAKASYEGLARREDEQIGKYKMHRRGRQLEVFLRGYHIRSAKIRGIGAGKEAALASYGIDTAADISEQKVLRVPGFGPSTVSLLMGWRRRLEGRFTYNAQENDLDRREINSIRTAIASDATNLRAQLTAGGRNLSDASRRTTQLLRGGDAQLEQLYKARAQLIQDLEYLGKKSLAVQQPPSPAPASQRKSHSSPTSPGPSARKAPPTLACPLCGSQMVRRTARRGSSPGKAFLGCPRYPKFKGTRNI